MKKFTNLGKFLESERQKKGLKKSELGKRIKVHPQYVLNWERGRCAPPGGCFHKLIDALEIDRQKLVEAMLKDSKSVIEQKVFSRRKNS